MDEGLIFPILFVIVLSSWTFDLDEWFRDEITVYEISCNDLGAHHDDCIKDEDKKYLAITFKVFPNIQTVLRKTSFGPYGLAPGGQCTVLDKENWECSNDSENYLMMDGDFKYTLGHGNYSEENLPKWRWLSSGGWRHYTRKWFGNNS